jgi:hypothetical protein
VKLDAQLFPPGEEVAKRFVLEEMIGKGPFGEVYRATDKEIDADVVVKVFDEAVLRNPLDEEKFLNATRAARSMTQPNLVRIHDSGVHKGHPWVSMQHLEGLTLRKVLDLRRSKNETFALEELEPIVSQVTLALQHVARDFPHGDLKPENIVFLPDLLKVTDTYILAALSSEVIIDRLKDSPYFAPELHNGQTDPDTRADVYSVGVLIGEMLFGPDHTPGSGSGDLAPIDALVKRATAFDPNERYPTVEALSEDLATLVDTGALLGESGESRTPPPPPGPPGSAPPAPPPGPAPPSEATVEPIVDPEEDRATVEYDRDLDQEIQDMVLTEEVKRVPPPPGPKPQPRANPSSVKTAAAPKPRKVAEGPPWGIVAIVALGVLALAVGIGVSMRDNDVEQIGQTPVQTEQPEDEPKEEPKETTEDASKVAFVSAATAARQQIGAAGSKALEASKTKTSEKSEAESEKALAANQTSDTADGARKPSSHESGKGSPKKADEGKKASTGTDCPNGMALVKSKKYGHFCIDRFEYPGRGATPKTRVSWFQAKKICASKGKRLCEQKEWRRACGGKYPYGRKWDADRCNTADEDGFERSISKAGSFKKCRSRSGAYDMVGNVHEWVAEQRIAGGGFESGEDVASCRYSSPKSPASSAGYIGFRCCAQPE